jgi:hypothetical protein
MLSTAYVIMDLQIKTAKYQYTCVKMAKPKNLVKLNADNNEKQVKLSFIASGNAKWYNYPGKQFGSFLQN